MNAELFMELMNTLPDDMIVSAAGRNPAVLSAADGAAYFRSDADAGRTARRFHLPRMAVSAAAAAACLLLVAGFVSLMAALSRKPEPADSGVNPAVSETAAVSTTALSVASGCEIPFTFLEADVSQEMPVPEAPLIIASPEALQRAEVQPKDRITADFFADRVLVLVSKEFPDYRAEHRVSVNSVTVSGNVLGVHAERQMGELLIFPEHGNRWCGFLALRRADLAGLDIAAAQITLHVTETVLTGTETTAQQSDAADLTVTTAARTEAVDGTDTTALSSGTESALTAPTLPYSDVTTVPQPYDAEARIVNVSWEPQYVGKPLDFSLLTMTVRLYDKSGQALGKVTVYGAWEQYRHCWKLTDTPSSFTKAGTYQVKVAGCAGETETFTYYEEYTARPVQVRARMRGDACTAEIAVRSVSDALSFGRSDGLPEDRPVTEYTTNLMFSDFIKLLNVWGAEVQYTVDRPELLQIETVRRGQKDETVIFNGLREGDATLTAAASDGRTASVRIHIVYIEDYFPETTDSVG